jgi:hypothetical protein
MAIGRCRTIYLATPSRSLGGEELRSRMSMAGLRSGIQRERIGRGHGHRRRGTSTIDQNPVVESEIQGICARKKGRIVGTRV